MSFRHMFERLTDKKDDYYHEWMEIYFPDQKKRKQVEKWVKKWYLNDEYEHVIVKKIMKKFNVDEEIASHAASAFEEESEYSPGRFD